MALFCYAYSVKRFNYLFLWLLTVVGSIALIAYLRILFFYNNGHVDFSSAPLILLVLSLPLMASGIYGLVMKKSFGKQPLILQSSAVLGVFVFIILVVLLVTAMYAIGQSLQGNPF